MIPNVHGQKNFEKKLEIRLLEAATFFEVNNKFQRHSDTIYHSHIGFRIYPDYVEHKYGEDTYIVLTYPEFHRKSKRIVTTSDTLNILQSDKVANMVHQEIWGINGKRLAIKKETFELIKKETLYDADWKTCSNYGLSFGFLTVPFKLRPKVQDTINFNLTTDVTLGPYLGLSKRLSGIRSYYITLPITLGVSYININNHVTSNKKLDDEVGVVPGITFSSGLLFQLEDFNLGVMLGKDWASGVGVDWIYHNKWWFSFAIGYNFISRE
jgi:hypothetical protein